MPNRFLFLFLFVFIIFAVVGGVLLFGQDAQENEQSQDMQRPSTKDVMPKDNVDTYTVIADNLEIPWDIAFLPDGDIVATERNGTLSRIRKDGTRIHITQVGAHHRGEGGLLGVAIHPLFEENNYIYLYSTQQIEQGTINRVERFTLHDTDLSNNKVIIDTIPGAIYHDGGRIDFGPDGYLYITTGDATTPNISQDRNSLAGKILRVTDEGAPAPNNPFGSAIFSLGHRNPQGLAWDKDGTLWSTEHGRSGSLSGLDEINKIQPGANYGWPLLQGSETESGFVAPVLHSGSETWAPASASFVGDTLFFGGLRGSALYGYNIHTGTLKKFYTDTFGRIRTVRYHEAENALYITTSNRDGRGDPLLGDDKIIKIPVDVLSM